MTLKEAEYKITNEILGLYSGNEARAIAKILLSHLLRLNNTDYSIGYFQNITDPMVQEIPNYIERLRNGEPVQYITGEAHFLDFNLKVNRNVLIPRKETEELTILVKNDIKSVSAPKILDIGTGSGCIAVSLKYLFPDANLFALDVSKGALEIAGFNARKYGVKINFIESDILDPGDLELPHFDVIVSNPPYITLKEKIDLHPNVRDFEPSMALFVEDNDPLIFYARIIKIAGEKLKPDGKIYFEVHENLAHQVMLLFDINLFRNVQVLKDMQGKERFVIAEKIQLLGA